LPFFRRASISGFTATATGLDFGGGGSPDDILTPIATPATAAKATTTIRIGSIFRGIFLTVNIPFLTGTVKLVTLDWVPMSIVR
jgi:hypothetical protein